MRTLLSSTASGNLASPSPWSLPPHGQSQSQSAAAVGVAQGQPQEQQEAVSVDSDTVVILASLLCALICVAGLALVARCAWRRHPRSSAGSSNSRSSRWTTAAPKGLSKKAIEALPTVWFGGRQPQEQGRRDEEGLGGECAICLAEFAEGEQLRVLPHCAHGFHVACIDTWLGAHASCPSCRATTIIACSSTRRCRRCGASCELDVDDHASPAAASASSSTTASGDD
ncbi:probable E3 ubiquitin-protein ligase ATL44 [Phragmites australis]|uniref:probable E3 ubiquitin-protein ligase ATL44 n=1 Tax=Phragmites australis TaxID=29695 RepID=UPI002D779E25|nr:probable E3 ubiquitin-protein ligase ATL44 [Phragmites australis]